MVNDICWFSWISVDFHWFFVFCWFLEWFSMILMCFACFFSDVQMIFAIFVCFLMISKAWRVRGGLGVWPLGCFGIDWNVCWVGVWSQGKEWIIERCSHTLGARRGRQIYFVPKGSRDKLPQNWAREVPRATLEAQERQTTETRGQGRTVSWFWERCWLNFGGNFGFIFFLLCMYLWHLFWHRCWYQFWWMLELMLDDFLETELGWGSEPWFAGIWCFA